MHNPSSKTPSQSAGIILATAISTSLRTLIISAASCFIIYWMADALKAFAGKESLADLNFFVGALADMKLRIGATIALTGSGWAYGLKQRQLRRNTVERLATRITELETKNDPNRSSSQITRRGTTRKED